VVVTLHRPSNVDDPRRLSAIAAALREVARERPVVFPAHPRTAIRLAQEQIDLGAVRVIPPVSYLEMVNLIDGAHGVVTDSGGVQEETTVLGVPCFTLRGNTERPVTITQGTNRLAPDPAELPRLIRSARRPGAVRSPEGWDGQAAKRIVQALIERSTRAKDP
jgi:UDP-N-acetylglucosamine 2-epimerase (non-hydrolysing)